MASFDLDQPLLEFAASSGTSYWTIRHAVEGVQIFGGIGSGKSSGSGRTLALKYLAAGFGGLVLTVKPDEKQEWEEYCRLTGRAEDLLVLEPGGAHRFNFLEFESTSGRAGQASTENIVDVLKTVIRAGDEKSGKSEDSSFWETALDMLIFNVIDLCRLAYDAVSVQQLYDIVQSVPKDHATLAVEEEKKRVTPFHQAFQAARNRVSLQLDAWTLGLTEQERQQLAAPGSYESAMEEAVPDYRLLSFVALFFRETLVNLSEKTRSIIDFTFAGFLYRLLREPIYSLFCHHSSTVTPYDSLRGKVLLLNLPVKVYHKVGRDCQILFKYIWQRAMEQRDVTRNPRPMFLWADEAQNFLHEHDAAYQATARSSRVATVYISQNLPNYYASMGGQRGEHRVKSFLGTLGTKIFHANADTETNRYASELIGDSFFEDTSAGVNIGKESFSHSRTQSLKLERLVRPEGFICLKTGGPENEYRVEGYLHRQGNPLRNGRNHTKITFNQRYLPTPG